MNYENNTNAVKEQMKNICTSGELSRMPRYSIKAVYEKMEGEKPKMVWTKSIWNRLSSLGTGSYQ